MDTVLEGPVRVDRWLTAADERSPAEDVRDGLTRPFKELPWGHLERHRRHVPAPAGPRLVARAAR